MSKLCLAGGSSVVLTHLENMYSIKKISFHFIGRSVSTSPLISYGTVTLILETNSITLGGKTNKEHTILYLKLKCWGFGLLCNQLGEYLFTFSLCYCHVLECKLNTGLRNWEQTSHLSWWNPKYKRSTTERKWKPKLQEDDTNTKTETRRKGWTIYSHMR